MLPEKKPIPDHALDLIDSYIDQVQALDTALRERAAIVAAPIGQCSIERYNAWVDEYNRFVALYNERDREVLRLEKEIAITRESIADLLRGVDVAIVYKGYRLWFTVEGKFCIQKDQT